jgi:hypothetical protein
MLPGPQHGGTDADPATELADPVLADCRLHDNILHTFDNL